MQLHQREEKDRTRKLKLERYDRVLKEMSAKKTENDAKMEVLRQERDNLSKQLSQLTSSAAVTDTNTVAGNISGSIAANLADALANPPAYLSGGDPATSGLWSKMTAASRELRRMEEEKAKLESDIAKGMQILESMRTAKAQADADLQASACREETALAEIRRLADEVESLNSQLNAQKADDDEDLRARLRDSEKARKKLHAQIQDLKGNVRVLVRMRPFLASDDETSLSVAQINKPPSLFHFDHVFGDKSEQAGVYKEVSELIQSSLDGYRVCVFSYGQTGSGKTWTMSGDRSGAQRGIIPRAVNQIIEQTISLKKQGWAMNQLLDQANRTRTTVATGMNERSSRSHMVFMLELHGVHADGVTVTHGGLRLVDLAGSERLDRTGTLNDTARLKETVNINKSLSCLSEVFMNLGAKSQHIPYRNSKLTMLLQDCLSGTGKSLMIVNVSPTQASVGETLCSLRFADQVSQVELGKAQKQMYLQAPAAAPQSSASSSGNEASKSVLSRGAARKRNTSSTASAEADTDTSTDQVPVAKRTKLRAHGAATSGGMWKK
eukprot:GSChrysophyteH1.ASY1.ANO1.2721.1 assembled CDS